MNQQKIRKALDQFMRVDRLHHAAIQRQVGEMGLHRSQHRMLMYLSREKAMPSQRELADFLEISPPAVASTLKRLEAEGYIQRTSSKEDSRNNIITITDKGRAVLEDTHQRFDAVDRTMFEGVSEAELESFTALLDKIQTNLQNFDGRCKK